MRYAKYAARTGDREVYTGYWWEDLKEREHSLLQIRPILYTHSKFRSQAFILPVQDAIRNRERERPTFPYFTSEYVSVFDRPSPYVTGVCHKSKVTSILANISCMNVKTSTRLTSLACS